MKSFLLAACLLLTSTFAIAQGIITGSITGTVADASGAVLPGAQVQLTNGATNYKATAVSGSDGSVSFKDVPIGKYSVTITAPGFSTYTLNDLLIGSGRTESLGTVKLTAGNTATTIEVLAAQSLLETTQSQVTTTFNAEQVADLPLGGGFDEVALLIPGVVATHADNFSNSNGPGFSVNGERGRANNFELDGQSNNDNSVAGPQVFFGNEEAIAQVQVITNNFAAEYGRNAGSVINYITKSGTNQFHGSAIYKFSGDFTSSLDTGYSKGPQFGFCAPGQTPAADNCTAPVVPRYVSNWYGGTLGGPIIKDKLFAFGSTYFQRFTEFGALTTSASSLFPTPAGLTALAAAFPNSAGVAILQQLSPYAVTVGNPRQTGPTINETVTSGGTTVTIPFSQYGRQIPTINTDQEDLGRIDWQATDKDRIYVRYFYQKEPDFPGDSVAAGGFYDVNDVVHSVGADETHIFGPHWVDQLRYSFQQSTLGFNAGGFANCNISSFGACPSQVSIGGTLSSGGSIGTLGLAPNLPQGRIVKVGQVQDNATWTIGKHTVLFGGEFDYTNSPNVFLPYSAGAYSYDNLSDFIGGTCAAGSACYLSLALGNPTSPFKEDDVAFYLQDDWKVKPSLTLNLGLRWEFFQQAINLLHNESVATQTGSNPLWSTALPLSQTTFPAIPDYYKNFEPRLGFAYNPDFMKKLVIRGGYAINVDPAFYNINLNVATAAPVVTFGTVRCTGSVNCLPTGGATLASTQAQKSVYVPTGGNPGLDNETTVAGNFRNPLGQTMTLGVQYQIANAAVVEARYVGNHTSRQFQSLNGNPNLANVAAAFPNVVSPSSLCAGTAALGGADAGQLHCGTTIVDEVANTAFSQYNSIQTNITARNYHGIVATFGYTHSKNIDNVSEVYSTGGGGNTIAFAQNPLNTDLGERGASGIDFPNTASVSMVYNLPTFHTGKGLLDKLANGWQTDTIWIFNSGQPFTDYDNPNSSSPNINPDDPRSYTSYSDQNFIGAAVGADVARPILSNPKAPISTLGIYTDTTITGGSNPTFSAPFLVDYGTGTPVTPSQVHFIANNQLAANLLGNPYPGTGRNTLRGFTTNNVDFNVVKDTKITERIEFRFEADAFNVLNRSSYGTPQNFEGYYPIGWFNNSTYNSASGSLIGTGTGIRNMEFTGKIRF
jgi:hypothetical protein